MLSIVGAEHSTFQYHQRKVDQEQRYLSSRLDATVVRATQFHDFPVTFFEQARPLGVIPVFLGARFQTVDPDEVAELLAHETVEPSGGSFVEIGGPRVRVLVGKERHSSIDLALRYLGLGAPEVVACDAESFEVQILADEARDLIAACSECAVLADDIRQLSQSVASLPVPARPRDFARPRR